MLNNDLDYQELKKKFAEIGYVFSKNDFKRGYSAARDIGSGWTDSNSAIIKFQGLTSAKNWLNNELEWLSMTEDQREEKIEKEYQEFQERLKNSID